MKYTLLHGTEIKVSKICLGTMTFGEQNNEQEAHEQLDYALAHGVNFIDTAEMYAVPSRVATQGLTEEYIGNWIDARKVRNQIILATKITGPSRGMLHIRNPLNFSPKQIDEALEGSLRRLKTDYIDLYQLHWPERMTNYFGKRGYDSQIKDGWIDNIQSVVEKLNLLIKQGKIRSYGVSNETPWGLHNYLYTSDFQGIQRPVCIQNPYNLLNRSFEVGLSEMSIRENVGLLAYSPMAFGLLSGKYHLGLADKESRINKYPQMSRYNSMNSRTAASNYIDIAAKAGITPANLALAFVNSRKFVTSTIIGATSMNQLVENLASIDIVLDKKIEAEINSVHDQIPNPAP